MEQSIAICFGKVLRRLRLEAQMTQEALGLEAGLQRKYISSLELGEYQPTLETVFKLSTAMNIKPGKFVSLVEAEISAESRS